MLTPTDSTSLYKARLWIHLCTGEVAELQPATSVQLTQHSVLILSGEEVVTRFPRASVYFVSDESMEPAAP